MSKHSKGKSGIDATFVLKALLIGILGSVLLLLFYVLLERSWLSLIVYDEGLKNAYIFQLALLVFLVPIFTGALAVMVLSPKIKRYTYAIATGMISGILTGVGFTLVFSLFVETINLSGSGMLEWQAVHDALFSNINGFIADHLLDLPRLAILTLLAIMLSGVGGSAFYALAFYTRPKKSRAPGIIGNSHVKVITYMAAAVLVLAIIPPAIAFSGIQAGLLEKQGFHYPVTAQRLADDTIVITNNGGDSLGYLDPASTFIVYMGNALGGYDVTSQRAATREGLNVTVDPASGLGISSGSTVTIKGEGVVSQSFYVNNSTGKNETHIFVIGNTTDGKQLVYLDTLV